VIFNLTFCDSVSYAVPGNPTKFQNVTALADFYDNGAKTAYASFDYALQQIPCEIESSGQYSLARDCNDCRNAYKRWLCSVMIPRCMDYSSNASWLQPRNVVNPFPNSTYLDADTISRSQNILYLNSSRNPSIDDVVQPGPYKEILPCDDLCYNIVQSCPSSMQFSCPRPNGLGFNHSYGLRPNESPEQAGQITCNYPGAVYNLSIGHCPRVPVLWTSVIAIVLSLVLF
jgi:calcium channel MID1